MPTIQCVTIEPSVMGCFTDCSPADCFPIDQCNPDDNDGNDDNDDDK